MKKIILSTLLAVCAVSVALADGKGSGQGCSDKDGGCCGKAAATTTKADPKESGSCCAAITKSKQKAMHVTHVLQSPKAVSLG